MYVWQVVEVVWFEIGWIDCIEWFGGGIWEVCLFVDVVVEVQCLVVGQFEQWLVVLQFEVVVVELLVVVLEECVGVYYFVVVGVVVVGFEVVVIVFGVVVVEGVVLVCVVVDLVFED